MCSNGNCPVIFSNNEANNDDDNAGDDQAAEAQSNIDPPPNANGMSSPNGIACHFKMLINNIDTIWYYIHSPRWSVNSTSNADDRFQNSQIEVI